MRLEQSIDGREHPTDGGADDHHPQPKQVTVSNTSQSIAAGADYNLDIALGDSGYQWGRAMLMGPNEITPTKWNEWASVHFTRDASEAIGHTGRHSGSIYKTYTSTYSKQNSDLNLTHKVFDSVTGTGNRYIALKAAVLTGSNLRLTFHNYDSSARTLWVKGSAHVY